MKQHILVLEDSSHRRTIVLENQQYTLGRHSQANIQINSRQASRHHATLVRKINSKTQEESYWIVDGDMEGNKSQNGVFVNGEKRLIHELKNGDLINFGCNVNASYHITGHGFDETPQVMNFSFQRSPENEVLSSQGSLTLQQIDEGRSPIRSDDETFHEQSYLDTVTDLPNKLLFLEYLNIAISNAQRYQTQVGLLLCQITNWGDLKRKQGDGIANQLLQEAGNKLKSGLRNGDIVSRWDKDQFILMLSKVQDRDSLLGIARRLMKPLVEPAIAGNKLFEPEINYSVVLYPVDGTDLDRLLTNLQDQLEPALFTPDKSPQSLPVSATETAIDIRFETPTLDSVKSPMELQRLGIVEKRLEKALEQHELELYYQPQINWQNKSIEAMEAFIRWQHPQKGLLPPRQFLPWSDQTDFLVPLTQWILKTACTQNKMWQDQSNYPFYVSVNISERQFYHPQFHDLVMNGLAASGLAPERLELELRESTVIRDFSAAQKIIENLHKHNVRFSLDDFGTDYVSVRSLHELPFHKIKIDRSLTEKLITEPDNVDNVAMIRTIISLSNGFGLKVVAEGVEQKKQVDFFAALGCYLMQGFCFSEPLNTLAANAFLKKYLTSS